MVAQVKLADAGDARPQSVPRCSWCDRPGSKRLETEPAIKGTDDRTGKPVIKKPAKTAPACAKHFKHFEEMKASVGREKKRVRDEKRKAARGG